MLVNFEQFSQAYTSGNLKPVHKMTVHQSYFLRLYFTLQKKVICDIATGFKGLCFLCCVNCEHCYSILL